MQRLKLSRLIDNLVRHPDGQALGEVEEIDIDPVRGSVERITLRLGPDRNLHVVVPWSQIRYSDSKGYLELEIGRQALEAVAVRRER